MIPLALAMTAGAEIFGSRAYVTGLTPLVSALFVIASIVFIVRRLATHSHVTRRTVFGALCIYLFGALLFAMVYHVVAVLSGKPFFVQTDNPSGVDYIYFSFITMATVGFGDFSPATDLGRMTAVVEAVGGQLYLVVVVALFVGDLGHQKRGLRADEDEAGSGLLRRIDPAAGRRRVQAGWVESLSLSRRGPRSSRSRRGSRSVPLPCDGSRSLPLFTASVALPRTSVYTFLASEGTSGSEAGMFFSVSRETL